MNKNKLTIEIPPEIEYSEILLDNTFKQLCEKRNINIEKLYEVYNNRFDDEKIFLNESIIEYKKRKREFSTYQKRNTNIVAPCRFLYHSHDKEFTKIYIFNNDFRKNIVLAKIIAEVYFQKYVKKFSCKDKCNFNSPNVLSYGFVKNHKFKDDLVFYITMENVEGTTINNINLLDFESRLDCYKKYIYFKNQAFNIDSCLKYNGFFHNDLNSNNIMINNRDDNLFLIDYGEASCNQGLSLHQFDTKYCLNCQEKKIYRKIFF